MEDKWAEQVARMGDLKIAYRVLVGQPEKKENKWKTQEKFLRFSGMSRNVDR